MIHTFQHARFCKNLSNPMRVGDANGLQDDGVVGVLVMRPINDAVQANSDDLINHVTVGSDGARRDHWLSLGITEL